MQPVGNRVIERQIEPSMDLRWSTMSSFFDFEMNDIDGDTVAFAKFRDQVSLVVNVASK